MTDGVFYFVRVYLFVFVFFVYTFKPVWEWFDMNKICAFLKVNMKWHSQPMLLLKYDIFLNEQKISEKWVLCAKMGPGMNVSIWLYLNGNASVSDLLLNICNICNFYYTTIQKFGVFMILKQQISISE